MAKARVLIVDDSAVFRRALSDLFASDHDFEVVGTASNGQLALDAIKTLRPDLVTLDVEMPVMDGLATVTEIRKVQRRLPILMFSTLTSTGAGATLDALHRGASDYCTKPSGGLGASMEQLKRDMLPKARALLRLDRPAAPPVEPMRRSLGVGAGKPDPAPPRRIDVLAIGCSTGGPNALAVLVPQLPADLPVPVVIVQHMPPVFTRLLADRLCAQSRVRVLEAQDGVALEKGTVYIAPGDHHMTVERAAGGVRIRLNQDAPENFCRPAVDPLFRSVAAVYPGAILAAVLTGMGRDGTKGCDALRRAGAHIIAQDEPSSVVWGMPGSVVEKGLADQILPLDRVSSEIATWLSRGRSGVMASARQPTGK
jgi:two-component system chemotaxis response regulator CheB